MLASREGRLGDVAVQMRRQRDVDDLDRIVGDDVTEVVRRRGDVELVGSCLRGLHGPRGDAHHIPAHGRVGRQV